MNTGKTVFAQLIHRESLRDIESCLTAFSNKLYHSGIKQSVPNPHWQRPTKVGRMVCTTSCL